MKLLISIAFQLLLLSITPGQIKAQHDCGTNDDSNEKVIPSINYQSNFLSVDINKLRNTRISIPIQFHTTRGDDGLSDFEPRFIDSILKVLNIGFEETPFDFYQCSEINYIDNDDYETIYYYSDAAGQDLDGLFAFYNSKVAINIYLPSSIFAINVGAWAYFPWNDNHTYIAPYGIYNSNTHVHEMGHLLGLYHTHRAGELVDRSNCQNKGDLCCDTPAEPILSNLVDQDCNYIGNEVDNSGQLYQPDIGNHMSYAPSRCRVRFTQDQIDRMLYYYSFYIKKYQCDSDFEYTDISFENIRTEPFPAVEGQPYSIIADARNKGNVKTSSSKVIANLNEEKIGVASISNVYNHFNRSVFFDHRETFPDKAGRYLVCLETEGDNLEINSLDNNLCGEIVIRQKEGISDIAISNLHLPSIVGEQNALNSANIQLENIGSIVAHQVKGDVFVEDVLVDSFEVEDIEVGQKLSVNVSFPLSETANIDICIKMRPAFAEVNLSNNESCISVSTYPTITSDLDLDSVFLYPNDSVLQLNKEYTIKFKVTNLGPGISWVNDAYLRLNTELEDSINYQRNWGWGLGYSRVDSFTFKVSDTYTLLEICTNVSTNRDADLSNNEICIKLPVEQVSNVNEVENKEWINLYPNPTSENITIVSKSAIKQVRVINSLGKEIYRCRNLNTYHKNINLEKQTAGIYFIRVRTKAGEQIQSVLKL